MKALQTMMLLVAAMFPDPTQPRKKFDEEAECGLMQSLESVGQLVPVRVWKDDDKYWIEDGERRWRAARRLGWKEMAAIVVGEGKPDKAKALRQLIVNAQREGLSDHEQVMAVRAVAEATGWKGVEIARQMGRSEGDVSKDLSIAYGPQWNLELLAAGKIGKGIAYLIASESDPAKQQEMREAAEKGASKDVIAGMKKQRERPSSGNGNGKAMKRVVFPLGNGRSTSASGVSNLDAAIEAHEETLGKLRKMRTQGVELGTAAKMFRDQAAG